MFRESIRSFYKDYYSSIDFRKWQNNFAHDIYAKLATEIRDNKLREVPKIIAICDVMSSKHYRGLTIERKMIHGYNNSGVGFDYKGEKTRKELADMVIISLVTHSREIILLKTAFIQNKDSKDSPDKWSIDQKQLFLLKNFPELIGERGMFKGQTLTFLNHTGTLGNFGLFTANGDMTLLTAQNVFCNQKSNGSICVEDITSNATRPVFQTQFSSSYYRCKRDYNCACMDCNYCLERKYIFGGNLPFFSSYSYALDIHEVVRELTYFNIGEIACVRRRETNPDLYNYTNRLLASAFGHSIDDGYFNRDYRYGNNLETGETDVSVLLNHLELKEGHEK